MSKLDHELIDKAVGADGARDRRDLRVRRHLRYEVPIVKMCQLLATDPACHDRHVVDRGAFDHRVDGGLGALGFELASQMFFPDLLHGLLFTGQLWLAHALLSHSLACHNWSRPILPFSDIMPDRRLAVHYRETSRFPSGGHKA